MVVTMVEAEIAPAQTGDMVTAWSEITGGPLPPGLVRSLLLRADRTWRIVSFWESREALDEMRSGTEVPGAIRIFRAAGAEPTLTIFDVEGSAGRP